MGTSDLLNKKVGGVQVGALLLVFLFYSVFGFAYNMANYMTSGGRSFWPNILYDYGLKALYTIPIWWLLFRKLKTWQLWQKILLHSLFLPIFVVGWQQTYYIICDWLGMWHLGWPGSWWDIYIPGLFYVLQFGIFHVFDFYVKLQKQRELEASLRQIALQSELIALKAQLNPHFLYNTFNTISASVPPGQEYTRELIATLSDLFRYQLRVSNLDLVPLKEELAFIKNYMNLEKARFGDRLEFYLDIEDGAKELKVPPMILQPLVENAVKHGIAPKIDGGKIYVKVNLKEANIHFEIIDSGVGLNGQKQPIKNGIGLTNTRLRLEKMYHSTLYLEQQREGGVRAHFKIPIS